MTVSLEDLRLDGPGGLWEHLASLPDPRSSQGRRHSLISILKIIMAAFRNLVLSLSNLKKTGCFAELIRCFAWDREKVFRFLCL